MRPWSFIDTLNSARYVSATWRRSWNLCCILRYYFEVEVPLGNIQLSHREAVSPCIHIYKLSQNVDIIGSMVCMFKGLVRCLANVC